MKIKASFRSGSHVIISPHHWLRPCEDGVIIGSHNYGQKCWLVQFENKFPGGGIDGDKLWLDERDFAEVHFDTVATSMSSDDTPADSRPQPPCNVNDPRWPQVRKECEYKSPE